jgi:hypothetical protein
MVLSKIKHKLIRKTGTPITEMTNSISDHKRNRNLFIPAEQVMVIQALEDILKELKELHRTIRTK